MDPGHFSQVVWKSTTELGCGATSGTAFIAGRQGIITYVVCHYAPAGNTWGDDQYPNNVLKP